MLKKKRRRLPTVTSSEKLFSAAFLLLLLVRLLSYFCQRPSYLCVCVCVCGGNSTIAAAFVAASRDKKIN